MLIATGCGATTFVDGLASSVVLPPPLDDKADLKRTPIALGAMAFNEWFNDGYLPDVPLGWTSSTLLLTSDGHASATIDASFGGPAVPDVVSVRDALFWKVTGTVLLGSFGDSVTEDWSHVSGVWAAGSTPTTASFVIEGSFEIPPLEQRAHLVAAGLELTWVREWTTVSGVRYQVFAGERPARGPDSIASFDELAATPRAARFMYYQPRPPGSASSGAFNYLRWFATH